MSRRELKQHLSRYNDYTVPDNYYYAYKILFQELILPNQTEILRQAEEDIKDEEKIRLQSNFNRDRLKMADLDGKKYNWGSTY